MTFTEILQIKEKYLNFEDVRALDYVEKRWQESGCPVKRWDVINFLERMLQELKANGIGYPKILLLRKKQIQRREFDPESAAKKEERCPLCIGTGWKGQPSTGYVPCACSAGDGPRKKLKAMGICQ